MARLIAERLRRAERSQQAGPCHIGACRKGIDDGTRAAQPLEERLVAAGRIGELFHQTVGNGVNTDQQGAGARLCLSARCPKQQHEND